MTIRPRVGSAESPPYLFIDWRYCSVNYVTTQ
jgi:hypothetical protein